ncbi:MAG: TonB-dependent receptor [Pseudomonadota bacterium]
MKIVFSRRRFWGAGACAVLAASAPLALMSFAAVVNAAEMDDSVPTVDVVVVTGSRAPHTSFDLPAAVDVIDATRGGGTQMRVNASELLNTVPGISVLNRQNYAQDLQISSRGFGARTAFGVRGVRLLTDGIPAGMPDGQSQAATFNLDVAERIEVLRGPFSAMYGNHAGGVVQLFTREGRESASIETTLSAGSDGTRKADVNAQGASGGIGYVLDASRFETDEYRDHSAAARNQAFARLSLRTDAGGKLALIASGLRQRDTQDPLGVTWSTYVRDARAVETDISDTASPKRSFAERYDTRKSINHQQIGASYEQSLGDGQLNLSAYGGNREVTQYQAFSKAFQAPASHAGGVVDFDREFYGAEWRWTSIIPFASGKFSTSIGGEYGYSRDVRRGFENFVGDRFGVRGQLRRDEIDSVSGADHFVQSELQFAQWQFTAGIRRSTLDVRVDDRFLSNGNDSGGLHYSNMTPIAGVTFKVTPALNLYASAARGFETPTLNELFYSGSAGGFNFVLRPARSTHWELGAKAAMGPVRADVALFKVFTSDELLVNTASGGRTSYRNGGKTQREGGELSVSAELGHGLNARLALTVLRAVFREGFGNVAPGSRLPGVAAATLFGELGWRERADRLGAALEVGGSGKLFAEDSNTEKPAPGNVVLNARLNAMQRWSGWQFRQFIRFNNLFNQQYIGSVIVGDSNKRYYEAAPGRTWQSGVSAQYHF